MIPASIRFKNPGAMWGHLGPRRTSSDTTTTDNPVAVRWGSTETVYLHDGLGQGNNIAVFDTYVDGICAQLDLWRNSKNYRNKPFAEAIATWSGHNNVQSYIDFVMQRVPGMTRETVMNDAFWQGPMGIAFLKAQAGHEAGRTYPAPDPDWVEAQRRVFAHEFHKKVATGASLGGTAAVAAHAAGLPPWAVALIAVGVAAVAIVIWSKRK